MLPLLLILTALNALDVQVQTLSGESHRVELRSLTVQAADVVHADQSQSFRIDELLTIKPLVESTNTAAEQKPFEIGFVRGGNLFAKILILDGNQAKIERADSVKFEVQPTAVQWLRVAESSDGEKTQWDQIVENHTAGDLLVVRKQDALDYLEGIVRRVTGEAVEFEIDGDVVPVKWNKVFGVIFQRPSPSAKSAAQCRVALTDGSEFMAQGLKLQESTLECDLLDGGHAAIPFAQVKLLDFSSGKLAYLSDLEWEVGASERAAFLGPALTLDAKFDLFSPQRDRAFEGGPLLLQGKPYAKGLALHSRTRLVYRLSGDYHRFIALAGIDDRMGKRGNVRLVIAGDKKTLLDSTVQGGEAAIPIDVDVQGVRRLSILVDYGADQDISDQLNLCEAKLIK